MSGTGVSFVIWLTALFFLSSQLNL